MAPPPSPAPASPTPQTGPVLGRDDLVTGEAVALDLPVASLGLRLGGFIIDAIVIGVVMLVAILALFRPLLGTDLALGQAMVVLTIAGVFLVLPTAVEIATRGRSLGKLACGTRVVRVDHGPLSPRHSVVRWVIGLVEIWAMSCSVAGLCALFTPRCQRVGDLAAGTIVVKERMPLVLPPPVPMPPHLVHWAQNCDLGAVPQRLAMSARQFLLRRNSLTLQARNRLGHDLCTQALACVSPAPPPSHPEDVLAAVLAERARRDAVRWTATSSRWQRLTRSVQ